MGKTDCFVLVALLAIGAILLFWGKAIPSSAPVMVKVELSGREIAAFALNKNTAKEYVLDLPGGRADLEMKNGAVRLKEIDEFCPNKICIRTGWIRNCGESIVCAPNQLVIRLVGLDDKIDAISR